MLQHIPLAVTDPPPFEVIFPPDVAVVLVTPVIDLVVIVDRTASVVKVKSFPYAVPSPLVA